MKLMIEEAQKKLTAKKKIGQKLDLFVLCRRISPQTLTEYTTRFYVNSKMKKKKKMGNPFA